MLEVLNTLFGLGEPRRIVEPARLATKPGGIVSLESILGLLKSLKILARDLSYRLRNTYFGRCEGELAQPVCQPADRPPSQLAAQLAGRCAVAAAS